jgi:hypothetical protein
MSILLLYPTGHIIEGLLLAASRDRMRVAVPDRTDTVEFQLAGSQWLSEEGDLVEMQAILTDGRTELGDFCYDLFPRTFAAGN